MKIKNFKLFKSMLNNGFSKQEIKKLNFRGKSFFNVDFRSADFRSADFRSADFCSANFGSANFGSADFRSADFRSADFRSADFSSADFSSANFRSADFRSADFSSADFSSIINEITFGLTLNCPEEGYFVGYKKASDKIVVLMILEDSKRSSATTYKCRASKVKVLRIENLDGTLSDLEEVKTDRYGSGLTYKIGETIEITDFDDNRWNECSTGIHFFMNKKMAINY